MSTSKVPFQKMRLQNPSRFELNKAKQLAKSFNIEDVKSGDWFIQTLQKVIRAYDRNARAAYFQKKYPGLLPDEIADILTCNGQICDLCRSGTGAIVLQIKLVH